MLRSSSFIRSVTALPARRFTHIDSRNDVDVYIKTIRECRELGQVWNLFSLHKKHLSSSHVLETLEKVGKLVLPPNPDVHLSSVERDGLLIIEPFIQLCNRIRLLIPTMSTGQLIKLLAKLQQLNIPIENRLFNDLIMAIREDLQKFDVAEKNLLEVYFTKLSASLKSPNVVIESILIALKLVSNSKGIKLEMENPSLISTLIFKLCEAISERKHKAVILDRLSALYNQRNELSPRQCLIILTSISRSKYIFDKGNVATSLVEHCIEVLTPEINTVAVESLVTDIFVFYFVNMLIEYNEIWIQKAAEMYKRYFTTAPINYMTRVLFTFETCGHFDPELWKIFEKRVEANFSFDHSFDLPQAILRLIQFSNFEPSSGWDPWINALDNSEATISKVKHLRRANLIRLGAGLNFIDKSSKTVTDEIFHQLSVFPLREVEKLFISEQMHILYFSVALHRKKSLSENETKLLSVLEPLVTHTIKCLNSDFQESDHNKDLFNVLSVPMGGPEYVLPLVWTRDGLEIRNLVMFRKGNYAVKFNSNDSGGIQFLEDIKRPDGSILLSVLPFTKNHVSRNGYIRRSFEFRTRHLEQSGIRVVPINRYNFSGLEEREKTPYLMSQITSKLEQTESLEDTAENF